MAKRKIKMGMVGGGKGAFIGGVHRMAANLDGEIELVCGAFSSNPEKSKLSGEDLYLQENRVYASFEEMIEREKQLPEGERMDFVSIVTPNHMHYAPAMLALENGFHVVCDKPLAFTMDEAKALVNKVKETGLIFCLTHNYTGYPMVKEARMMIKNGHLGKIRKVVAAYPQGWLSSLVEAASDNKQAGWRTDPSKAGASGCMGDIGTHAENLAEYITGLKIEALCADLTTFVPGRKLEDDGNVLVKFEGGAKGIIYASQISVGEENNLSINVYGEKGGIEWRQEEPNTLVVKYQDKPKEIWRTGGDKNYLSPETMRATRIPGGHPEGFIEAFANLYKEVAGAIRDRLDNKANNVEGYDFPTVEDGLRGMAFIENLIASSNSNQKWHKFEY